MLANVGRVWTLDDDLDEPPGDLGADRFGPAASAGWMVGTAQVFFAVASNSIIAARQSRG
jgi:hypothetical protein